MKKMLIALFVASSLLVFGAAAFAADFDFLGFAQNQFLTCAHPTADPAKAKVEFDKEPAPDEKDAQIMKARVRIFYEGWLKKNSMLVDISYMETASQKMVKADVLEDTAATGTGDCVYTKGWQELK